jgi:bifunctional enzyme CysN/CysC
MDAVTEPHAPASSHASATVESPAASRPLSDAGAPRRDHLRFITCGSVDDGKSTLIGRLLHDSRLVYQDQLAALVQDSARYGTTGDDVDFALLVDGLEAEREQGITIDVAYRYFSTTVRSFIVADTPGHEQYTRNMATGASTADLAVVLIDARKGVLVQTRRHSFICSLLGIRHVVAAINKIDLAGFDEGTFARIAAEYAAFAGALGFKSVIAIPISARYGDNVTTRSARMPWYDGPALLPYLESMQIADDLASKPFRFPVQWINRGGGDFRAYAGTLASGRIRVGDEITVAPSGLASRIARIVTYDGDVDGAEAGDAVNIVLAEAIDVGRGDLLASSSAGPEIADQFAAHLIWMDAEPLMPGRSYLIRIGTRTVPASITSIKHRIDVNTREHIAAHTLELNDIGLCNVSAAVPIAFDPYAENRKTGAFIIVDRYSNRTVGAGMILFGLRRAANIPWQPLLVGKEARAALKKQKPAIVWFTGLSGAGKSTVANLVEQRLHAAGYHTMLLDGDNVRHGLNRDLGFTEADRVENIRRVGEVAKLMIEGGLIVLCSFISPYRAERDMVRALVGAGEFIEVHVDTPLSECMVRDPKGLYAKARAGQLQNFTGIDAPYEPPLAAELHLTTTTRSPDALAELVIAQMRRCGIIA